MSLEDSSSSSPSSATTVDLTNRRLITRRRRRCQSRNNGAKRPPQLDWPSSVPVIAPSSSSASPVVEDLTWMDDSEDEHDDRKERSVTFPVQKKSRKQLFHASAPSRKKSSDSLSEGPSSVSASSYLWSDKYTPKLSSDLAVAPKKVKQVKEWLQQQQKQHSSFCKFLILAGSPGIGKSTMVRILAKELQMEIHEWTEPFYDEYYCKTNPITNGNPESSSLLWSSSSSPLQSFQQFLESVRAGFSTLDCIDPHSRTTPTSSSSSLILIDEIPNLHDEHAEHQFRDILKQHVRSCVSPPTVWIYSDTVEGKIDQRRLGRILDFANTNSTASISDSVTYNNNNYYQIWHIAPPTKSQFRKVLKAIASQEGVVLHKDHCGEDDDLDELHTHCGGDLRFAISQCQFRWAANNQKQTTILGRKQQRSKNNSLQNSNHDPLIHARDQRLSSFHALGKLLYAKRHHPSSSDETQQDERPPLAFDPDTVMEQSEMELHGILHFLEHHCVDFFTDVTELADSLSYFSDAAVLYDYDTRRGGSKQSSAASVASNNQDHAAALACRSVACWNRHAAPSRFRQLTAPKIFQVMQKRRENQFRIETMSPSSSMDRFNAVVFATEILPWSRKIVPSDHPICFPSLFVSHFEPGISSALSSYSFPFASIRNMNHATEQAAEIVWREQQEILTMDDIVDDDDDDW